MCRCSYYLEFILTKTFLSTFSNQQISFFFFSISLPLATRAHLPRLKIGRFQKCQAQYKTSSLAMNVCEHNRRVEINYVESTVQVFFDAKGPCNDKPGNNTEETIHLIIIIFRCPYIAVYTCILCSSACLIGALKNVFIHIISYSQMKCLRQLHHFTKLIFLFFSLFRSSFADRWRWIQIMWHWLALNIRICKMMLLANGINQPNSTMSHMVVRMIDETINVELRLACKDTEDWTYSTAVSIL